MRADIHDGQGARNAPCNGPNTDARDQLSPDHHIRLAPHGRSIQRYMVKRPGPPSQGWRTFLRDRDGIENRWNPSIQLDEEQASNAAPGRNSLIRAHQINLQRSLIDRTINRFASVSQLVGFAVGTGGIHTSKSQME